MFPLPPILKQVEIMIMVSIELGNTRAFSDLKLWMDVERGCYKIIHKQAQEKSPISNLRMSHTRSYHVAILKLENNFSRFF